VCGLVSDCPLTPFLYQTLVLVLLISCRMDKYGLAVLLEALLLFSRCKKVKMPDLLLMFSES